MKLLLAGGGTGGHLFPAVAVAEQLLKEEPQAQICFVGTQRGLEARVIPQLGYRLELINISGLLGRGLAGLAMLFPRLIRSLLQSWQILTAVAPDVVLGVGGYASFPVVLAAWLRRIPCVIHEQNAWPGLSNRLLARLVSRVCVAVSEAGPHLRGCQAVVTGNPLRQQLQVTAGALGDKLLVFGGSRGAHRINQLMVEALPLLRQQGFTAEVIHQTGEDDLQQVQDAYEQQQLAGVRVVAFLDDMATAYSQARLVVCRAGATTLAELSCCGRPALLIPFPYATQNHQHRNAQAHAQAGAAKLCPEETLDGASLAREILQLWQPQERLQSMAQAAQRLARPRAAAEVLSVCRQVMRS